MRKIIDLKNITHQYNSDIILQNLNLSISEKQSIAFTGHNGCGKSTLLKIIAGLIRPTKGHVVYHGDLLFHYVPERFPKMNLTARQYLGCMGKLDGLKIQETETKFEELCKEFFLSEMIDTPMKHLSKGSLQKVSVIQALLTKPDVLMLDEPLSGQDTDSQDVFIRKMNQMRRTGTAVIMSCHEQYLMDSLTDTIYHIEDKSLCPVSGARETADRHYILWFEKGENPHMPDVCIGRLSSCGGKYKMDVKESESNSLIACMTQKGWLLRGMEDAGH